MCQMEGLDYIGCIRQVFRRFPACCVGSVVKSFPLNQIEEAQSLATTVDPAVQDPMDLPLIGVVQLDWGWGVYGPVGDPTRASGL